MGSERHILKKVQAIASIASAIAIPFVIAAVGWMIQAKIADQSTQKDYVAMAVGILTNPQNDKNNELRAWAVSVLNKTSPVPFPNELQKKLTSGAIVINKLVFPTPPHQLMAPPLPFEALPKSGKLTNGDLLNNWIENRYRLQVNAATQEALQGWARDMSGIINKQPNPVPAKGQSSNR